MCHYVIKRIKQKPSGAANPSRKENNMEERIKRCPFAIVCCDGECEIMDSKHFREKERQTESLTQRVKNQREEIRRLQKCLHDITQSRDHWKAEATRIGKQLNDVLYGKENQIHIESGKRELIGKNGSKCIVCGCARSIKTQSGWNYCPVCGAVKLDGGD